MISSLLEDLSPLIERAFSIDVVEHADVPVPIDGSVPAHVRGSCYFNGPARFERAGLRYRHWLDGDGMVCALRVGREGARLSNRFVRSEKFLREQAAGRPIFRTFGTAFTGDTLKRGVGLESPVNVSAYPFGGALLAFGEQGLPWELDRGTLETRGLYTFGRQINELTPFSAHPKIDYQTGELFNFGVSFSASAPLINLFRFRADGRLVYRKRLPLPYPASTHDFAISGRHIVVYVSPLVLRMEALLQEGATVMDALSWKPELGSQLIVADRETGDEVARLNVGHQYCLHMVNAFERDGLLVVDVVEYEKPLYPEYQVIPNLFSDSFRGRPVRLVVDVHKRTVASRTELEYANSPDFPAHDPALTGRPYDHFWMLGISRAGRPGRKFFDEIVRIDWPTSSVEVSQAPPLHYFGGEPLFVPDRSRPGTGAVICQMFDAERSASSFVVFDAFRLAAGPVATLRLPSPVPLLFHSSFLAQA
ncbi:MAG TPA: carotenoid oxygenase family protein [Vicinamibacterales bacterium]|nr:carotenoid oxygenase family protein [Vicinamibacterales bacterium]